MAKLRWRLLALLCWVGLFFNVEQLSLSSGESINLHPIIYFLGVVVAVLPLLPVVRRWGVVALVALTVVGYAIVLALGSGPVIGGIGTYTTLTGLFLLVGTAILANRVGQSVDEFHKAVEIVTLGDKDGKLHNLDEARHMVELEMSRSRRSQRPLSLMVLKADTSQLDTRVHQLVQEVQRSMMQRYMLATAARVLNRTLRRTDLVVEDDEPGRLVVVAPETSPEEAAALGLRIERQLSERLGLVTSSSVASFPSQALTFEGLLNAAQGQLPNSTVVAPPRGDAATLRDDLALRPDDQVHTKRLAHAVPHATNGSEANGAHK